ncbi:methyltransferase TYW3-domain-containing protein [Phyllosticta citrichinensis]|uniref:tRNA(Phe) 7-[(3-amino-3-carboxypropyl)-4-demethylwyosine(37)-N(4)]-methyltransferase n=1 Tax=Phyllosticta citrichinensis TaxID=1130410 RepID=A0ABR1XT10_9PEZI
MSSGFLAKKKKIVDHLDQPINEYSDLSPKGSIDQGIRTLIDEINQLGGLVTTSSCAGRISAFLEGRKKTSPAQDCATREAPHEQSIAGPGGKGGGQWLFVSHDAVELPSDVTDNYCSTLFGLQEGAKAVQRAKHQAGRRYVHLKFEAMILHLLTASLDDAQKVLSAALQAGFRESGAVGLATNPDGSVTPMVAVRSIGLAFDAVVGYEDDDGKMVAVVSEPYLRSLVELANERFAANTDRIERFRSHLLKQYEKDGQPTKGKKSGGDWEDAAARRERKRAEGLKLRQSKAEQTRLSKQDCPDPNDDVALESVFD